MIRYDRENYNCSHVVADYYQQRLGVTIPSGSPSDWGLRFIRWMRKRFTQSVTARQDCLVLMINRDGSLHVGVYDEFMITHGHSVGQVVRSPLALLKPQFRQITYWVYNGND